ncbi:MAG TPA: hypothetical protein PLF42_06705 [Anaerolineales bacterium]|nr:hypothetical protein [Anaerolineales bacterium]
MKRKNQRDEIASLLFGLTEDSVTHRVKWRFIAGGVLWLVLSGFTMLLTVFSAEGFLHRGVIVVMSFLKYLPLLAVVYSLAKRRAAHYLDDIYELHNEELAMDFIEEVAFGYGHQSITINEGKISEEDEHSPIILVGGPGQIQVNLGSAALLEKLDGEPEVIYARSEPWSLGRFERIREIGKHDEIGKREYAVVNLRDQFVSGLSVKARTKDGIPIEALDIKVLFSILRPGNKNLENDPYPFDERAMHALVYNQTTISPPPSTPSGVTFPWDTTVIPLVVTELERLITSRTLNELLASISQKEIDSITQGEETVAQMRVEMTGGQTSFNPKTGMRPPNFESRSKITAIFLDPQFRKKAADTGISIEWIDVGTWQLQSDSIVEKLKEAWNLTRENARRKGALDRLAKKHEMEELVELVNSVIIANYEKKSSKTNLLPKEFNDWQKLKKLIESNPEVSMDTYLLSQFNQPERKGADANSIAIEMLKAFRKELVAAKELIQQENKQTLEEQQDLARIEKALRDIARYTSHYV